eukprot:GHRR01009430.1.p1 GENE.GHRR01009430.1~~GHRR01009430.1.p1  ORF type:complete len:397 (+),score=186.38 GHRR01009430.1:440-1630(+)
MITTLFRRHRQASSCSLQALQQAVDFQAILSILWRQQHSTDWSANSSQTIVALHSLPKLHRSPHCCASGWTAAASTGTPHLLVHSRQYSTQQTSSLRSDLGSDIALGDVASRSGTHGSTPSGRAADRKSSLLDRSGRFYDTVVVVPYQPSSRSQVQQTASVSSSTSGSSDQQSGTGSSSGYQLLLRKHPIKTPAQHGLVLPTRSLALAIAAEWEWLPEGKPVPHLMPLMGLAATAIDQPRGRKAVIDSLLKYVHTDGACIRYEPGPLQRRQQRIFDPLLQWASEQLDWDLVTSDSIFGTTQSDQAVAAVEQYLKGLDAWHLAAAEQLISASKSVVIAAALLHNRVTIGQAVAAARVEEDFQLEDWGMVEAGHDLDIADMQTRMGAPTVFIKLLAMP